ncbi:MAG: tetratricopeptide repeat protein [Actinobacteria bacterium]|nr:tetratricopeptide repeat protein [Actinomycetota bacterium]
MSGKASIPSSLEIHVLGPYRVAVDGTAVDERRWSRHKPKLLVKLLALQPHHQLHREQLIELLWPDLDAVAAANNLHKAIHMARHALEPELKSAADSHFILTRGQQVVLSARGELWVDAKEFERRAAEAIRSAEAASYESALALYGGDLLVEDLYEDWAAARREQLRALRQELLVKLAHLYESGGEYGRSIERLKELVADDASNEEAHRRLMSLYARTGNRRQSLRQYQQCREALERELQAAPEPATVELHERIISGRLPSLPPVAGRERDDFAARDSLAILPLTNAGADPDAEYLSDGITESIINSLSQLPALRVLARSTVFRYKGREVDPQEVGRALGVRAVLTGRVMRLGERLVIRAELVDASDGAQLWGGQYDRDFSDVLAVQEEIARQISESLQLKLTGEERKLLTRRHTDNTEAYHAYLRGRYCWNKRTEEELSKSVEYFRRAIKMEPNYALAYAGLADSYIVLGSFGISALAPSEAFPRAKEAATRALEIDETLAEAHASLAFCLESYDWNWAAACTEFKRAIELKPDCTTAHHWYGLEYLTAVGRLDEAYAEIKRAHELEPLSLSIHTDYGFLPYLMRQYDRAIEEYRKSLELDQGFVYTHWKLGLAYEQRAMYEEAIAEFQKAIALSCGSAQAVVLLGHAYAVSGRRTEALKVLDELNELSKRRYVSSYRVAAIHLGLGEKEQAFEWLERAYEEHDAWLVWLKVDPVLDDLHEDPRFADLMRRVGLLP